MIKDEMKNRISMALKDPILQQGFECICKELEAEKQLNEEIKVRFVKCNTCTDEMKGKCLMFSENLCEGDRCEELVDLIDLVNKSELQKENAELKEALAEQKQYNAFKCEDNKKTIDNLKQENARLKLELEALDGQTPWKDIKDKSEVIGQLTKAKEILQTVLDKWKEERWILQTAEVSRSEDEVREIENLMEQAEKFLKE